MVADAVAAAPPDVEPERGKSEDARYVTAGVPCPSEDAPEPECPQCADLEPKCARLEQSRRDLRKRNTDLRAANAATEQRGARKALEEAITQQGMRTAEFHHEYSDDDPAYEANRALNALKRQAAALDAEEAD